MAANCARDRSTVVMASAPFLYPPGRSLLGAPTSTIEDRTASSQQHRSAVLRRDHSDRVKMSRQAPPRLLGQSGPALRWRHHLSEPALAAPPCHPKDTSTLGWSRRFRQIVTVDRLAARALAAPVAAWLAPRSSAGRLPMLAPAVPRFLTSFELTLQYRRQTTDAAKCFLVRTILLPRTLGTSAARCSTRLAPGWSV